MNIETKNEEFEQFKELYIKYCESRNCLDWHCYNCRIADNFRLIFEYKEEYLPWQKVYCKKEQRCSMCGAIVNI